MSRFRFSEKAAEDLEQIDDYLSAEAGDDVAEQVVARILAACDLLATQPGMGHRREDLTEDNVRFWPVYFYLIVYLRGCAAGRRAHLERAPGPAEVGPQVGAKRSALGQRPRLQHARARGRVG